MASFVCQGIYRILTSPFSSDYQYIISFYTTRFSCVLFSAIYHLTEAAVFIPISGVELSRNKSTAAGWALFCFLIYLYFIVNRKMSRIRKKTRTEFHKILWNVTYYNIAIAFHVILVILTLPWLILGCTNVFFPKAADSFRDTYITLMVLCWIGYAHCVIFIYIIPAIHIFFLNHWGFFNKTFMYFPCCCFKPIFDRILEYNYPEIKKMRDDAKLLSSEGEDDDITPNSTSFHSPNDSDSNRSSTAPYNPIINNNNNNRNKNVNSTKNDGSIIIPIDPTASVPPVPIPLLSNPLNNRRESMRNSYLTSSSSTATTTTSSSTTSSSISGKRKSVSRYCALSQQQRQQQQQQQQQQQESIGYRIFQPLFHPFGLFNKPPPPPQQPYFKFNNQPFSDFNTPPNTNNNNNANNNNNNLSSRAQSQKLSHNNNTGDSINQPLLSNDVYFNSPFMLDPPVIFQDPYDPLSLMPKRKIKRYNNSSSIHSNNNHRHYSSISKSSLSNQYTTNRMSIFNVPQQQQQQFQQQQQLPITPLSLYSSDTSNASNNNNNIDIDDEEEVYDDDEKYEVIQQPQPQQLPLPSPSSQPPPPPPAQQQQQIQQKLPSPSTPPIPLQSSSINNNNNNTQSSLFNQSSPPISINNRRNLRHSVHSAKSSSLSSSATSTSSSSSSSSTVTSNEPISLYSSTQNNPLTNSQIIVEPPGELPSIDDDLVLRKIPSSELKNYSDTTTSTISFQFNPENSHSATQFLSIPPYPTKSFSMFFSQPSLLDHDNENDNLYEIESLSHSLKRSRKSAVGVNK